MADLKHVEAIYTFLAEFLVNYSFQVLGALFILAVGYWLAGRLGGVVTNIMLKQNIDVTLSRFTGNSARAIVVVMVALIALTNLGISITPLIAGIGAVSLGAGLAVQGMLSNYAAGFTIIITRPFVVGDTIAVQGQVGVVEDIHLGYTMLRDDDNVAIQIPNRHIVGEVIRNSNENTVLDLSVNISYGDDPERACALIAEALNNHEALRLSVPAKVGVLAFAEGMIKLGAVISIPSADIHGARFLANSLIYQTLSANGISLPVPRQDIHVFERNQ